MEIFTLLGDSTVFYSFVVDYVSTLGGKDLTTGKTTKYAYEKGRVSKIGEFNQSDTMIAEETLSYDNIGRLVKDEYIYDKSGGKSVGSEIEYNSIGYPSKYKNINYKWANGKLAKEIVNLHDAE